MTDNELKQAIICCIRSETVADCKKMQCPALVTQECIFLSRAIDDREDTFYCEILRDALDLINRQQAEIEQWKEEANRYQNLYCMSEDDIGKAKSEAVKEFAERLKDKSLTKWDYHDAVDIEEIDNLVKEMVGDTE